MKNEKRILIIPSWYPPDGGYFFKEHSEAFLKTGWKVDVLVNRLVGVRKLIQAGWSALRRYRVEEENGLRVIRSSYLKMPGNEKYNILGWARQTARIYKRYEKQFGRPDSTTLPTELSGSSDRLEFEFVNYSIRQKASFPSAIEKPVVPGHHRG